MQQLQTEIKIMQLLSLSVIIEAPLIIMIFNVRNFQKNTNFTSRIEVILLFTQHSYVEWKKVNRTLTHTMMLSFAIYRYVICIVHPKSAFKFSTIMINIKKFQLFKHINSSSIQKIFTKSCALCKYASKRRHCRQIICGMS